MSQRRRSRAAWGIAFAICGIASGASPLVAQRAPVAGTVYQPGIDALDYDIHLDLPDTGAFIKGDVTVTLRRARAVHALRLDLVRTMTVRSATVNGVDAHVSRGRGDLHVAFPESAGDTLRVRVRYDGVVTDGLIVQHDSAGHWTWFGDNWPDRARNWLPTVDHPSDKATVSFTVRAPSARTVVANGTPLGISQLSGPDAGRSETRWREASPIATYLMVIGAGELARVTLDDSACVRSMVHRCVEQTVYARREDAAFLPGPFAAAPAIVSYFESLVGPFPYEKLAHLQSATRFGGMENASAIFYADRLFRERTLSDGLIAHETAHQWFGDAVTEGEWAHLWLSEGFATYFAALWTRRAHGDAAFAREMADIRTRILADPVVARRPVIDSMERNHLALLNTNSYQKGAYVLYMLHQALGDDAFFSALREYYRTHRDGTAVTQDLQHALETASHRALGSFFDQWLRRAGVPVLQVGWQYETASGRVVMTVTQDGGVAPYELTVPVEVVRADGSLSHESIVVPASVHGTVPLAGHYSVAPRTVRVDPDSVVLGRVAVH